LIERNGRSTLVSVLRERVLIPSTSSSNVIDNVLSNQRIDFVTNTHIYQSQ